MSSFLIIILLGNVWLGYNLSLIELYAHLSVRFVLYNVSDLMLHSFYRQVHKCYHAFWHKEFLFPPLQNKISLTWKVLVTFMTQNWKGPLSLPLVILLVIQQNNPSQRLSGGNS